MANYKKSDSWLEILLLISILQNSWKWFLPSTAQGVSDDLITSNGLKVTEEKISRDSSKMLLISWFADKGVDKSIWRRGKRQTNIEIWARTSMKLFWLSMSMLCEMCWVVESTDRVKGESPAVHQSSPKACLRVIHFNAQSTTETHFYWIKVRLTVSTI